MFIYKIFSDIEYPERSRLKVMDRVPQFPTGLRPPKMQKRLRYMRGPEQVHNFLMYRQYGIVVSLLCSVTKEIIIEVRYFYKFLKDLNYRLQEEVD